MSYEALLEGREHVDAWSICTICLNVARTPAAGGKPWRCPECGSSESNGTVQTLRGYLAENSPSVLEANLRQWNSMKGMRAAYRMLKAARYKCLLTLSKLRHS